jgi:pSer/pThr/pTyr-binding forkhead associated (FHA) protein
MDVNLILFKKDGSHKVFPLPSNVTAIGRQHNCDLYIPLLPVSRKHCQLNRSNNTLEIRDLGSRNGTYLNGERVTEAEIKAGDYITIGPLTFLLQIDGKPEKIAPPKPSAKTAAKQQKPKAQKPEPKESEDLAGPDQADSFIDLEESDNLEDLDEGLDKSDSFLDDLKDV